MKYSKIPLDNKHTTRSALRKEHQTLLRQTMSAIAPDLIVPEGAGETQTFQKLPSLPPSSITPDLIVPEGARETQVFQKLLSLPPSATPQEKGAQIAAFIKPQDDPALAYNAFQVAVKIAVALPPGSQDDLTLVPSEIIKALNREELISKARPPPPPPFPARHSDRWNQASLILFGCP